MNRFIWQFFLITWLGWQPNVHAQDPPITSLAFTPDQRLLVGSQNGLRLVDWPSLTTIQRLETSLVEIDRIAFSPDSQSFVVAGGIPAEVGQWEVWSWPKLERRRLASRHDDVVSDFDLDSDGELITASLDGDIRINAQTPVVLRGHSKSVLALRTLPGTSVAISAGRDQSVRVWDLESGSLVRSLNQHTGEVRSIAVRPNGQHASAGPPMIATAGTDRTVRFWQPTIGRMVRFIRLPSSPLDLIWTEDGTSVIAVCEDGHVRMVNATTLAVEAEALVASEWLYSVAIAPTNINSDNPGQNMDEEEVTNATVELAVGTESGKIKRMTLQRADR